MDPLHDDLAALLSAAHERAIDVVVIGALAVRGYLVRPDLRHTRDIDLLFPDGSLPGARALLEALGYQVFDLGPWIRGERGQGEGRRIVDVAAGAVVDMASFASYPLDPGEAVMVRDVEGLAYKVPRIEDLLALKLLAHRDKDLLDLLALLRDAGAVCDARRFRRQLALRDLEIPLRRGYLAFLSALDTGALARLWEERTGHALPAREAEAVKTIMEALFP